MKFWKKLVLFMIATISVILSVSRYYVVRNNFLHSIENSSKQNMNQYILEKYMLSSNIIKTIQEGEEVTNERIIQYLKSLHTYMGTNSELVALYTQDYEKIYSNAEEIDNLDITSILSKQQDHFYLQEIGNRHYMLFPSNWSINNKVIYIINAYDIELIYVERDRQMKEILIADVMILGVSSIIICVFSVFLTKPIEVLNKTSKKIALGKLDQRVNIKSKDEIGELADSFNIMSDEIESRMKELNLAIKQKDDFITGFTHELKTPMTTIVGYSDLLRLRKCDEELSRKAVQYIYQEAKRLEKLSFKLMKLMSLTNEKVELVEVNVQEWISKVVKAESEVLEKNKLEIEIEEGMVIGDADLLEVVMRNLIENANRAEPKDNKIIVKGEKIDNGKYRISVIDKGKGIPKEHIDRVTEDFYMVDKSRNRINGGSGIGLSLVKKILTLHHSNLSIQSKENVGTIVYFELEAKKNEEKDN